MSKIRSAIFKLKEAVKSHQVCDDIPSVFVVFNASAKFKYVDLTFRHTCALVLNLVIKQDVLSVREAYSFPV